MNAVVTKLNVTAAAIAVGAAAVFAPIAANAAPAVSLPTAPVNQVVGDLAQTPGDLLYAGQVLSLQILARNIQTRSASLDRRATRLEAYAAAHPDTYFGQRAAATAERLRDRRADYGDISFTACRGGSGVAVGPYGTFTTGPC